MTVNHNEKRVAQARAAKPQDRRNRRAKARGQAKRKAIREGW